MGIPFYAMNIQLVTVITSALVVLCRFLLARA